MMLLLGYDIGSSSIKAALLEAETGRTVATATSPARELPIDAPQPGWAEQDPETWWTHVVLATAQLRAAAGFDPAAVQGIGLAYQMHGLVLVDADDAVLRPAIIWCDGRAAPIGAQAFAALGPETCLRCYLNSPGNFTASKLRWVREHEPDLYARARRALLPGDYVALRLTGEATTTAPGLSEGIFWHMAEDRVADELLAHYDLDPALLPPRVPTFGAQGRLTAAAAAALGLAPGTPVTYRAGDQPNNALALGVLAPGQAAATAGTSGVVYGVTDQPRHDAQSRVNVFLHVNHTPATPRYGVLLCVNGAGSVYRWVRDLVGGDGSYAALERLAAAVPPGADGLTVLPFGNGAERTLGDRDPGGAVLGFRVNRHGPGHLVRAAQEGIAFAFRYGLDVMAEMGAPVEAVRAGHTNMFQSHAFTRAFVAATGTAVERVETDGAVGAARGAGLGAGVYRDAAEAFAALAIVDRIAPGDVDAAPYEAAYGRWRAHLARHLGEA